MLDEIEIIVTAGRGGDGAVSFRRERYVPHGGPDGGDGGKGGDVTIEADPSMYVLDSLRRRRNVKAEPGVNGQGAKRHGRRGESVVLKVPVGTIVWERSGGQLADLSVAGEQVIVARGGLGGKGNAKMATSTRQAPRIAEKGLPGEERRLRLELRMLAEAGLVGLPNAGKSSLLRAMSSARPKVGAYPFTTLEPSLGMVETHYERMIVADIPGLVEGAHEGVGLGTKFLQHVQRSRVLVLVVDGASVNPAGDVETVRDELAAFGHGLAEKPWIAALNKIDLPAAQERLDQAERAMKRQGVAVYRVSALNGEGVPALIDGLMREVQQARAVALEEAAAAEPPAVHIDVTPAIEIRAVHGGFRVVGRRAEDVVAKLGVETQEARAETARRLLRMGVGNALRRAGAKPGDRVRIGREELTWPL
jgi:GTP-binding protein